MSKACYYTTADGFGEFQWDFTLTGGDVGRLDIDLNGYRAGFGDPFQFTQVKRNDTPS